MRVTVINRHSGHYPLGEALKSKGVRVSLCHLKDLALNPDGKITHKGSTLESDAVLWRVSEGLWNETGHLLKACQDSGMQTINTPQAISLCADKWTTYLHLQSKGVACLRSMLYPPGAIIPKAEQAQIIKPPRGSRGSGVQLLPAGAAYLTDTDTLVQPYAGDWQHFARVMLCDHKVIGSLQRKPAPGEVASNLQLGGTAIPWQADQAAVELACSAAQEAGALFCAVDIVMFEGKWQVLEINSAPGYQGLVDLCGPQVCYQIAESLTLWLKAQ